MADELERIKNAADPECKGNARDVLLSELGFAIGYIHGLRDQTAYPPEHVGNWEQHAKRWSAP